jgi:hypothetical protein
MIGLEPRNIKVVKEQQLEHIIQKAKWIIHANKQLGQITTFNQVLGGIRQMIQIQKIIALRNGRSNSFDEEWGELEILLTQN